LSRGFGVGDVLWTMVAVLVIAAFLTGAGNVLWDVAHNRGALQAVWLPIGFVCAGWLSLLAWRRTTWGRPSQD
jgi:hypothetical protein